MALERDRVVCFAGGHSAVVCLLAMALLGACDDDLGEPAVDGSDGVGGSGGSGGSGVDGSTSGAGGSAAVPDSGATSPDNFSFFYTSLEAMQRLAGNQVGFGGDLRFGAATGLEGADKICQTIASGVGFGGKTWRAFLSIVSGPDGQPVNAIDRIGEGPWYDRNGRLLAQNKAGLVSGDRPAGEAQTAADLPDESGLGTKRLGDTHDVITGSNRLGQLRFPGKLASTCQDWTSASSGSADIGVGHSWPAGSGAPRNWLEAHTVHSCAAGVNLVQNGPGNQQSIGAGGGWGGFYCFALTP
jgi:hypothetical protein